MATEVATADHLSSPIPPLLFDFCCSTRRDPKNSPPRVDPGLPYLTGIAHNIRKGKGTTQIFSHISGGADFVMLGEVNKELDLPFNLSTGPSAARIFHNLGEGGTNGVALVVGPRLAPFTSPLPPLDQWGLLVACLVSLPLSDPFVLVSAYCPPPPMTRDFRGHLETAVEALMSQWPNVLLGGDLNSVLEPPLDMEGATSPNTWPWLDRMVKGHGQTEPRLVDHFRSLNPSTLAYTRYRTSNWPSAKRIDLFLGTLGFNSIFPPFSSDIIDSDKSSDHHPLRLTFSTPYAPPLPPDTPPRLIFRSLKGTELETFRGLLAPLGEWCSVALDRLGEMSLGRVQQETSTLLLAVSDSYKFSTSQHLTRKVGRKDKRVAALRDSLPPPDSPAYKAALDLLTEALEAQVNNARARRQKKLHRALASGRGIKRAVEEALRPVSGQTIAFRDPETLSPTADATRNCQLAADSLSSLGGQPDFSPSDVHLEPFLAKLPSCPPEVVDQPLEEASWDWFTSKLASAAHGKAGGEDGLNFYILSVCPEPVRRWVWRVMNLHLSNPMPEAWQRSNVFLLYKKGDLSDPKNYRPISLLGVMYKLVASFLSESFSILAEKHQLHHDSQIGGLANRRTSDHILHLASLIGGQTSGYTPPPPLPLPPHATIPLTLSKRMMTSLSAGRSGLPPPEPLTRPLRSNANLNLTLTLTLTPSPTPIEIVGVVLTTST